MAVPAERVEIEKSVEDLEKEITCAVCQEHYTDPKVLPCCHYYCKQCIYRLALRTGLDKPFSCPECRKDATLPQGGVDNLQTAFFVNRLKELHSKMERAHGKVEAKCELCSGDKAEAFCRQCAQFICEKCVESHQRMKKVFPGHKIATFDELKEGGAKEIIAQESPLQMCTLHKEPKKIFCFDCSSLICRDCIVKDHSGHNYEFISVAAPEMKKKLIQQLEPLKEVSVNISHAVEKVQTTKSDIEAQGESVANEIRNSCKELREIIEKHEQELLKEAAVMMKQKLENLYSQEKSLSTANAVVQSVIEYTQQSVQLSAEDEIMCMHAELENGINREIEEHCKEGMSLEPVEEVNIGVEVSCAEDLKQLCQTKAKVGQLRIDPTKCTISGEGVKAAEVNKMAELSLTVKLDNGKNARRCSVECHLKSLVNESIIKCNVDRIQDNEYRIWYTPTIRGRHQLTITVNEQEVAGSPFPVLVSIPPTQLGKPVKVINTEKKKPWYIAINSTGEIIVTGSAQIDIFNKEGVRLRSIKPSYYGITNPSGVAVDSIDCVYIRDYKTFDVLKLSKNMDLLKKTTSDKQATYAQGVTVLGDELFMCDSGDHAGIQVSTKELEYVRRFGEGLKSPKSISSDEHGKLYVSDYDDSSVKVFDKDGKFLRSFGRDENDNVKLHRPYGVCVAGQYVYVTDSANNMILAYTTEGKYVTSFGQQGGDEGNFKHPSGVCVDNDYFLYICDIENHRIQVF